MYWRKNKNIRYDKQRYFDIGDEKNKIKYPSNKIKTSKYTLIDFFPKTLFQEF
jgi:hypothetical protein